MARINGLDGLTVDQVRAEVAKGGRFVIFTYVVSVLILTFRQSTDVYFIKSNESSFVKALPWIMITGAVGWWGFPWGFIYTPISLIENLSGGKNVTNEVMSSLAGMPSDRPSSSPSSSAGVAAPPA